MVKEYIEEHLFKHGYESWIEKPDLEELLMLKILCEKEIDKYFT